VRTPPHQESILLANEQMQLSGKKPQAQERTSIASTNFTWEGRASLITTARSRISNAHMQPPNLSRFSSFNLPMGPIPSINPSSLPPPTF